MNKPTEFSVRDVELGDRTQWESLFLAYGVYYETAFTPLTIAGVWEWLMEQGHPVMCFVAVDQDTILGFAHLRRQHDTFSAGPSWFLDDLFTTPKARGLGVGRALITRVKAHATAHGGGELRWFTEAENTTAQRLYDTLATKSSWVVYEDLVTGEN